MARGRTPTLEVESMAVETSTWRPEPMSERVVVRCYQSYQDAKRAVDTLTVAHIPPKRITVFGRGLRWREAFTAERVVKACALGGAAIAAAVGLTCGRSARSTAASPGSPGRQPARSSAACSVSCSAPWPGQ